MLKISIHKSTIVQSFSPKGEYEGLLLKGGGELFQVNFPQEWSSTIAEIAPPRNRIKLDIEPREVHGHPSHPVYELIQPSKRQNRTFSVNEPNRPGNGHFAGKIERLNYALHGEVNGAILEPGDFLHVKPHGSTAQNSQVRE